MQQLGQYVVSLTAGAILSSLLISLLPEGGARNLLRLVCSAFLTVTALSAFPGLEVPDMTEFVAEYQEEGASLAALGAESAASEQRTCIKQALETYILDKAAALGAHIQPKLSIAADGNIQGVELTGRADRDVRRQLADILTNDLGIPEENQQWTLENSQDESGNTGRNTVGPS